MRISRTILIALAIATLPFQAQAHRGATTTKTPVDVAAAPAYPTVGPDRPLAGDRRAASHRRGAGRTARHSRDGAKGHLGPSLGESGIVRSSKTGAIARVAPRYAAVFQAYIDDLEAGGATVRFMGGYRPGPCASWSEHPCGKALDVCQLARGVVDSRCHLPSRTVMIEIANRHGLQEGGEWCNNDKGHAQIDRTAARCGQNLYSAVSKFKNEASRHRHHRIRYARR